MKTAILTACLLLAGCESTSFQAAPVADATCPAALAGDWGSVGSADEPDGEVVLHIDTQCQLRVDDRHDGAMRTGDATRLHVGADGGLGYLWVEAGWAVKRFDLDTTPPAGDVMLVRYHLDHDALELRTTADREIAHRLIDNKLHGEVRQIDGVLSNRVLAPVDPRDLRDPALFDADALRFHRIASGAGR